MAAYRSLTNQILIFGILDLNFSLNFNSMQAAVLPPLSYSVVLLHSKTCTLDMLCLFQGHVLFSSSAFVGGLSSFCIQADTNCSNCCLENGCKQQTTLI